MRKRSATTAPLEDLGSKKVRDKGLSRRSPDQAAHLAQREQPSRANVNARIGACERSEATQVVRSRHGAVFSLRREAPSTATNSRPASPRAMATASPPSSPAKTTRCAYASGPDAGPRRTSSSPSTPTTPRKTTPTPSTPSRASASGRESRDRVRSERLGVAPRRGRARFRATWSSSEAGRPRPPATRSSYAVRSISQSSDSDQLGAPLGCPDERPEAAPGYGRPPHPASQLSPEAP